MLFREINGIYCENYKEGVMQVVNGIAVGTYIHHWALSGYIKV
jgi:hypothetical protein